MIALAATRGFGINQSDLDLVSVSIQAPDDSLTDAQLDMVAGGSFWNWLKDVFTPMTRDQYIAKYGQPPIEPVP